MDGEIAAAGDAVTGGLMARAAGPRAGEAGHGRHGALCLNCGTRLIGEHCHACGQSGHVHRTVGAIGHELAHGVFHFEGKIWRTLPMLAFRPGELTRRYIAGERARFVSPLALFLFSVFLMFAVVANLPGASLIDTDGLANAPDLDRARAQVADEMGKARADLARRERRLAAAQAKRPTDAQDVAEARSARDDAARSVATLERAQQVLPPPDAQAKDAAAQAGVADSWLEAKYRHAKENPKLLIYKLKSSAYKYSWALIPISLPFIWLLFPFRRDVGLYDHAVFATYSLSFMSLFAVLVAVVAVAGGGGALLGFAVAFAPPIHIYKQLKGTYRLGRAGALWRTAWMLFFTLFTTTAFVLLLLTMGVAE